MIARYDGKCASCDGSIRAGVDEITRDADGFWVHANLSECADAPDPNDPWDVRNPIICRVCNTAKPCWCDDDVVQDAHLVDPGSRAAVEALARYKAAAARDPFEGFL